MPSWCCKQMVAKRRCGWGGQQGNWCGPAGRESQPTTSRLRWRAESMQCQWPQKASRDSYSKPETGVWAQGKCRSDELEIATAGGQVGDVEVWEKRVRDVVWREGGKESE